jgi:hypothetical protein
MSRWAETFAVLSRRADNLDTMRHSGDRPPTVSLSVNSVAAVPAASELALPTAADRPFAVWRDSGEERAAIVEREGAVPKAWAEGFALLDPNCPPGDVPARRWQRLIDDVGLFLDSPFCAVAATLSWGPHDLFGCDPVRPFARIDRSGLLWLLNGAKLIALTENTATIERPSGARQTYRRRSNEPGRVLAWELGQ